MLASSLAIGVPGRPPDFAMAPQVFGLFAGTTLPGQTGDLLDTPREEVGGVSNH